MLEVIEADPDLANFDDTVDDDARGKGKGKRAREEGFGGTGLAGGWDQSQERNDSVEVMEVDSGADVAAKEEQVEEEEDDQAIVPANGSKRPRRRAASNASRGGGSTSGASSKRSSGSSTKKTPKGGKKKKDEEMDVDENEEEGGDELELACSHCTLINEPGVEVCMACDNVLLPPGVTL